jgi:hypothetical protein
MITSGSQPNPESSATTGDKMDDMRGPSSNLHTIGAKLLERLPIEDINLIPLASKVSVADLRQHLPEGEIVGCDFYIANIEQTSPITGGFNHRDEQVKNIDHHAPVHEMFRHISSGNLAAEYVEAFGIVPPDTHVVINHTDCDSIISSLIVRGHIPPNAVFDRAVIAADHTGEENRIADLLQALDPKRDLNFSARNLGHLLTGQPLEPEAARLLQARDEGRALTQQLIQSGNVQHFGKVALVPYQEGLRNEFLPAVLPDSAVILMAGEPHQLNGKSSEGRTTSRLRLGLSAPEGFTIFDLQIPEYVDSAYGGRWNAGANRRGGGTNLDPAVYAKQVQERFEIVLKARG